MNAGILAIVCLLLFFLGYRFYARFLGRHVFCDEEEIETPAHAMRDGLDYVPTRKHVLFGHHFTSVAGLAPIVGPAIAVFWGWLPALLWVVLGTLFVGAVHDFGCLVLSARNKGRSIPDLTARIIGDRARLLFLLIVLFLTWIVIAVFAYFIARLFVEYPASVFPINFEIVVAVAVGWLIYRKKVRILIPSLVALVLLYLAVWVGAEYLPLSLPGPLSENGQILTWILLLLGYSFVASVLPVWTLLQPRDYINSHQLFVGLGLLYLGLLVAGPPMTAPAFVARTEGSPIVPFLFVTIACGAISGFHGLVASGTTSKQLDRLRDARFIGYGGMIGEGTLALMSVIACTAGFASAAAWHRAYHSWEAATKGGVLAFVSGGARLIENGLGLDTRLASALLAVIVISFGATTLDTATRIQRYILAELGDAYRIPLLTNRFIGSAIAAFSPIVLVLGQNWTRLWPIFGAANQMLAALSLLVLSVYLARKRLNPVYTFLPLLFLVAMTAVAMAMSLWTYGRASNWLLVAVTLVLLVFSLWIVASGWVCWRRDRLGFRSGPMDVR